MALKPETPVSIPQDSWKSFSYKVNLADELNSRQGTTSIEKTTPSPVASGTRAMLDVVNNHCPYFSASSILDIACGPGTVYNELFAVSSVIPLSASATLLGVDISPPMIAQIHDRQASCQEGDEATWSRVKAWVGDATNLEGVPDGSQSHVLSQMGIFAVPNHASCLREARRVMVKDGTGIFAMTSVAYASWNTEVLGWIEKLHPDRKLPVIAEVWRDAGLMKAELEKFGFERAEISEVPVALGFGNARTLVDGMFRMLPFMPKLIEGLSKEEVEEIKVKAAAHAQDTYPDGKLPGKVLLGIGF